MPRLTPPSTPPERKGAGVGLRCKHQYADHCPHCAYERSIYNRGKADGIKEGMERAAGICDNTTQEYTPYTGDEISLNYTCAQAIREAKEKL